MKIVLEVKNGSKAIKPNKNDIVLYDGKQWYITTRSELFKEYETLIDGKILELEKLVNQLKSDNDNFKKDVSKNISDISKVVKKIYAEEEN